MEKMKYANYMKVTSEDGHQIVIQGPYQDLGNGLVKFAGEIYAEGWGK